MTPSPRAWDNAADRLLFCAGGQVNHSYTAAANLEKETLVASLQWDRLLETCYRRDASDLLLTAGSPPMIRVRDSWRTLQVPALDIAAIRVLANERLGTKPDGEVDGYAFSDFRYGDVGRFRAMAFGYPDTKLLLVSKYPGTGKDEPQEAAV